MIINHKILSIPPHISTPWKNIDTIHTEEKNGMAILVITLTTGKKVEITNLSPSEMEKIFSTHAEIMQEDENRNPPSQKKPESVFSFGFPLKFDGMGMENMGSLMQHNQEQANSPDLPSEMLNKVASIAKSLGMQDSGMDFPKAEPHCNCPYCQIAKAIDQEEKESNDQEEEIVSPEELTFRDWDISQEADKLYIVTNPLDKAEHYQVFLGNPIGCTCGNKNCEHIRAVLNS